jgi:protein kinase-like protein
MSFIQGETLQDYMKYIPDGKLPLEEALKIGTELCSVLHYLHTYQPPIIFRDLKPSNIMRDKNGHTYLIDFGIARHFKPGQEKDTASYASAGYAAPEQYGRAQTTPRSDIYSLGATLYQLISGFAPTQSPFRLPPLQSLVPTLPPRLATLITNMLDLEENRRPVDMMAVKQELQAIASSPTTPSSETMPAEQPSSAATPQTTGHPATTMRLILPAKVRSGVLTGLGSVLALIGLGFLIRGTGIAWHQYIDYHYADYYYLDYPGAALPLIIGSSVLLLGFFTLYIPWAKNLSIVAVAPITSKRKTLARVGVFLGYMLLIWGIWGWIHAAPDIYNGTGGFSYDVQGYFKNPYMGITLGFAFIALTGVFTMLATTTKSFGLSHTKSKMEMTQRIIATLATFILVVGTTFLQT